MNVVLAIVVPPFALDVMGQCPDSGVIQGTVPPVFGDTREYGIMSADVAFAAFQPVFFVVVIGGELQAWPQAAWAHWYAVSEQFKRISFKAAIFDSSHRVSFLGFDTCRLFRQEPGIR